MYDDSQRDDDYRLGHSNAEGEAFFTESASSTASPPCSQGHRSSLNLRTLEGGSICLVCFSNLITSPQSPTVHVSYALAQLSIAVSHRPFLQTVVRFHSHMLVSPLVQALVEFGDEKIADQIVDLVSEICRFAEDSAVCGDFVTRISDVFCAGCLAWSKRQAPMLHCIGILLTILGDDPFVHIKDTEVFLSYLIEGLQMPSEDIRGEIMFVLYRLVIYHYKSIDTDLSDDFYGHCPNILYVTLDALMKTQSDDVRLNCLALLVVFAQRGAFENSFSSETSGLDCHVPDSLVQTVEGTQHLISLLAEAVKGPLLSSDSQVQIRTLELLYHHLSWKGRSARHIQELVEESIADYIFEVLRSSEKNDTVIHLCIKVLDIMASADQVFSQRLPIGLFTLVPILNQVAEVPFHPVQSHVLKLILVCVSDCPGVISIHQIEELGLILTKLLEKHIDEEIGMLPETFNLACTLFATLTNIPSSAGVVNFATSVKRASERAVSACLSNCEHPTQLLFSLYLLKEAYSYCQLGNSASPAFVELQRCILDLCNIHLLPWIIENLHELESEEIIMGVLETFHVIMLPSSGNENIEFARNMVSMSWFSFSFECMGLYPTESMRLRVFMLFGELINALLGDGSGQPVKDAASQLPSDPREMLFILRQRAGSNHHLTCCQNAALLIFYVSSLYNERLADEKLVLNTLEEYILGNSCDIGCSVAPLVKMELVNTYALYRGLAKMTYQIPYSPEAERILFQMICDSDWDILTTAIHGTALKWLFQQDKLSESLSLRILKFSCSYDILEDTCRNNLVQSFAELVEDGDNYVAMLFVCILKQLLASEGCQQDVISVMHMMLTIINIHPHTSNQFCSHGIVNAVQILYSHRSHPSFIPMGMRLVFNILSCVQPEELSDDDVWVAMTVKLVENMSTILTSNRCSNESVIVVGILSLILNHSANGVLQESAKIILLNISWISAIKELVDATCSTKQTFENSNMGDGSAETLLLLLLLQYFSHKSLPVVLPGYVNWQHFLDSSGECQSSLCCHCNDFCRLLYFGSPLVKLVASSCLAQLFESISKEMCGAKSLNCGTESLMALMAVFEGLIFSADIQVAMNCALCLTHVLQWKNSDVNRTTKMNKWCRFITEELVMSMTAPCLSSNLFTENCKAAALVSVAVLRMDSVPPWVKTVFDEACISGIVANLSPSNISAETVILFQELLRSGYLNPGHIASIEKVLQACRKHAYSISTEDSISSNRPNTLTGSSDDALIVCDILIHLMLSKSSPNQASKSQQNVLSTLIEAIDVFFMKAAEQNDSQ